jgi:hypothetical protein
MWTALLDELPHVRLAVYSFNGAVLRRFCRPTRDAGTLTGAIENLVKHARGAQIAPGEKLPFEAIPIKLARQFDGATTGAFIYEALTAALTEADAWPDNATRIIVLFSQAWPGHRPGSEVGEAVALANRLGIVIDPVLSEGLSIYSDKLRKDGEVYRQQMESLGYKVGTLEQGYAPNVKLALDSFIGLADRTGGIAFQPQATTVDVVKGVLQAVAEQVRWQYVAAFKPVPSTGAPIIRATKSRYGCDPRSSVKFWAAGEQSHIGLANPAHQRQLR